MKPIRLSPVLLLSVVSSLLLFPSCSENTSEPAAVVDPADSRTAPETPATPEAPEVSASAIEPANHAQPGRPAQPLGDATQDTLGRHPMMQPGDPDVAIPFPSHLGEEPPLEAIAWHEAPRYLNRKVTVVGTIVRTGRAGSGWPQFLDFTTERDQFNIVVFPEGATDLPEGEDPASFYDGRTVLVHHTVTTYRNNPQFRVDEPGLIQIVDPADFAHLLGPGATGSTTADNDQPETLDGLPVVAWDQAHRYVGQEIYVTGEIVNTYYDAPDPGQNNGATFLNFDTDWRDKFYLVAFPSSYNQFPGGRADQAYEGRTIRVRGEVDTYRGRPRIELSSRNQITVIE